MGSSATNTAGGFASAGARLSICCSPPDSRPGGLLAPLPEDREPLVGLFPQLRRAEQHREVLLDREPGEDAARLGGEQHAGACPFERLERGDVALRDEDPAPRRDHEAGDRAHSVDFPAPFAPRSATTLPRAIRSVDAVEHLDVAVAGDDFVEREPGVGVGHDRQRRGLRRASPR